jgi:hypothetical protein
MKLTQTFQEGVDQIDLKTRRTASDHIQLVDEMLVNCDSNNEVPSSFISWFCGPRSSDPMATVNSSSALKEQRIFARDRANAAMNKCGVGKIQMNFARQSHRKICMLTLNLNPSLKSMRSK